MESLRIVFLPAKVKASAWVLMNTVRYVQGEHLSSVSPLAFVSRQEAPYPAAASGGYHGDAPRSTCKSFYIWLFCARLITIFHCFSRAIVRPSQRKSTGKIKRGNQDFIGFCLFRSFHMFYCAKKQLALVLFESMLPKSSWIQLKLYKFGHN
jgi:hypothetical protein